MDALSDQLFLLALLSYAAALLGFCAAHLVQPRPASATAMAGRPPLVTPSTTDAEFGTAPGRHEWATGVAIAATVVGVAAQVGCLVTRAAAEDRTPWSTVYEFIVAVTAVAVLAWLCLAAGHRSARPLGLYVMLTTLALLGAAGVRLHTAPRLLAPESTSIWLAVHVIAVVGASGIFLTGFLAAVATLLRARHDARLAAGAITTGLDDGLAARLPATAQLERHAFWLHAVAFPIWTFAVVAGAVGANVTWGGYGWDLKETWALLSWIVYAGYLCARATSRATRTASAWIAVAGWASMWVNLFGVSLVISGLHTYNAS